MASPVPLIEALETSHIIQLTVLDDMRLFIYPAEVARDAEHNSATFRIARQPASLDGFVCRAEVQTSQGTNYRLVGNGEFVLTTDIAVQGINTLQLIYSDGAQIVRKTYQASFHVSRSINAVDPSDPDFENGLAQLQQAAFTQVIGGDTEARFFNISGDLVSTLTYPPGQGGGLDEATADTLYLRLNGLNSMQASVGILGPNRGIAWEDSAVQGALYSNGTQLIMRRALGNTPIVIEDNSGAAGTRSPILTQAMADTLYVTPDLGDIRYLQRAGGQMTGPLITATGTGVTNPGLAIGDNSTGFYRAGNTLLLTVGGQIYAQWLATPPSMMSVVALNMASQGISNVADPAAAQDAVNRRYLEAQIAAIPRPTVPMARTYLGTEVTIGTTDQVFFDQPFFTNDNAARTILITIQPEFDGGTPSQFADLIYTTNLSAGLQSRITVYGTAAGYMHGNACFAATVTPVSGQIQVQLSVRQAQAGPNALVQVGSRTNLRTYIVVQEMSN